MIARVQHSVMESSSIRLRSHSVRPDSFARFDLLGAIGALPVERRRLIEQLFWEERTEAQVANAMGAHQSTINRRKQVILNGLRIQSSDRDEFQGFSA
jgi:DNA-directed RNA polymerase specialized sigma24 family protein